MFGVKMPYHRLETWRKQPKFIYMLFFFIFRFFLSGGTGSIRKSLRGNFSFQ